MTPAELSKRQSSTLAAALADRRLLPTPPPFPCGPSRLVRPDYLLRHLGHIKVRAAGTNLIWYFTDFLSNNPNAALTRRYFPAGFTPLIALPPDAPPAPAPPRHIPGEVPAGDGLHDQQFALARIECSDEYGGSLKLHFNSEESFEYDARKGPLLWDLGDLALDLFVVPNYQVLNTARKAGFEKIYAEFHAGSTMAYTLDGSGRVLLESQDHATELATLWSQINTAISDATTAAKALRGSAGAFVYGAVHEIFQDRLTGTNVVAMMELGDHHLDIVGRTGRPIIYVSARITDIDFTDADPDGTSFIQLYACMEPGCLPFGTQEISVDNRDGWTRWLAMFSLDLNRCSDGVSYINVGLHSGHGSDEFSSQQPVAFAVDCAALNADVTTQQWGSNHIYGVMNVRGIDPDGHQQVRANIEVALSLQNR